MESAEVWRASTQLLTIPRRSAENSVGPRLSRSCSPSVALACPHLFHGRFLSTYYAPGMVPPQLPMVVGVTGCCWVWGGGAGAAEGGSVGGWRAPQRLWEWCVGGWEPFKQRSQGNRVPAVRRQQVALVAGGGWGGRWQDRQGWDSSCGLRGGGRGTQAQEKASGATWDQDVPPLKEGAVAPSNRPRPTGTQLPCVSEWPRGPLGALGAHPCPALGASWRPRAPCSDGLRVAALPMVGSHCP